MTSESLACLSDPGGRLVQRWRGAGKKDGTACSRPAGMVIVGASFSFQERIYTPACLPVVAWQGPVLGGGPPDLGQLEGCASSGQFSSRQSLTAQPTNSPEHNQEASCGTHQPFSHFYSTQFQGANGHVHLFQQKLIQKNSTRDACS